MYVLKTNMFQKIRYLSYMATVLYSISWLNYLSHFIQIYVFYILIRQAILRKLFHFIVNWNAKYLRIYGYKARNAVSWNDNFFGGWHSTGKLICNLCCIDTWICHHWCIFYVVCQVQYQKACSIYLQHSWNELSFQVYYPVFLLSLFPFLC